MAAAASFNGGRSQTGLGFLQTGGEYAFLNPLKTAQNWTYTSAPNKDGTVDPALMDADGYPMSIQSGGYYAVCYVPASWVGQSITVQWDGGGTIRVPGTGAVGSTTSTNGSVNNSITCTCIDQRILPGASATNAAPNHIKNIRVSLTGAETTALNAGEVFRPAFKNRLLEAGFGVLRFMDWQTNNVTNMTDWASRKPLTHYSYYAHEFRNTASSGRPALYCGATSNSTNTYTITGNGDGVPASGAPSHMQIIQLKLNKNSLAPITTSTTVGSPTVLAVGTGTYDASFTSGQSVTVSGATNAIASLSWSGGTVTVTTPAAHGSSGTITAVLSGCTPSAYNGTYTFTVTGATTYTYPLAADPGTNTVAGTYTHSAGWNTMNGTYTTSAGGAGTATISFNSSTLSLNAANLSSASLFHNACFLDLNGAGAKPLKNAHGSTPVIGNNDYFLAQYFSVDIFGTAVFDADLDVWMLDGCSVAALSAGIQSGVPAELCLQLAAEIGAHPWFNIPKFACEAATDYTASLAAYCIANAPSWMIPRYETPNETFNTFAGFKNGPYGNNKANAHWGSADKKKSHGYWASVIGQTVAAAYGVAQANVKTQALYHMIDGVQTFSGTTAEYDEHATSAAYIAGAFPAPAGLSKSAGVAEAWRWCTHICIAQYWTPSQYGSSTETSAIAEYQTANATKKAELLASYADSSITTTSGGSSFNVPGALTKTAAWKTWAQSFSINRMCGYEGGYSPDYTGGNANIFRNDCKATANIALYLQAVFQGFINVSDNTFVAEFPSTFYIADFTYSAQTSYVWTLLKGDLESANTPMFDFIARFNKGRRGISPRLRIHG